ncbi:hypothetical protein Tco_0442887 [Tanacetum coccineum]
MWDVGMTQAGFGVAGRSSYGIGFNHSGLGLICERCTKLVSSESDILAVSGIVSEDFQADDCVAGGCDEPEAPESCLLFLLGSKSGKGGGGS